MKRSTFVKLGALAPALLFVPACKQEDVKASAIVGVFVGEVLLLLPHPAMRVTGIILVVGANLIVTYIDLKENKQSHSFAISSDQSESIQATGKIKLQRKDGEFEERKIDEEKYPETK